MTKKFRLSNGERVRKQQTYDREKIYVIKCGQKINVYDSIQEASVDTDIYKTLEKYGSIEPLMNPNLQEIREDFENYFTLMDLHEQIEKANNMWNKLDAGVREYFHNDKNEFVKNGQKWVEELIEKNKPPQVEEITQTVPVSENPITKKEN